MALLTDQLPIEVTRWPFREAEIALERSSELTLSPLVTSGIVISTEVPGGTVPGADVVGFVCSETTAHTVDGKVDACD